MKGQGGRPPPGPRAVAAGSGPATRPHVGTGVWPPAPPLRRRRPAGETLGARTATGVEYYAAIGCYNSEVPLDQAPQASIDRALVGAWRCLPFEAGADAEAATVTVGRETDLVYAITLQEGQKDAERYQAHASLLKGTTLLNVKDLDPRLPAKPWNLIRYSFLLPDVLQVQVVGEKLLGGVGASPVSLRQELERLSGRRDLFQELMVCVRVSQASKRVVDGADPR
jgi:hypothetical protein